MAADGSTGQGTPFRAHPSHPRIDAPGVIVRIAVPTKTATIASFEVLQPQADKLIVESDSADRTYRSRVHYDSSLGDFTCANGKLIRADKEMSLAVGSSTGKAQTVSELSALQDGSIVIQIISQYTGTGLIDRRNERKQSLYRYLPVTVAK